MLDATLNERLQTAADNLLAAFYDQAQDKESRTLRVPLGGLQTTEGVASALYIHHDPDTDEFVHDHLVVDIDGVGYEALDLNSTDKEALLNILPNLP